MKQELAYLPGDSVEKITGGPRNSISRKNYNDTLRLLDPDALS